MSGGEMPDMLRVKGGASVRGEASVPGDKSISHRAIILGALAEGRRGAGQGGFRKGCGIFSKR